MADILKIISLLFSSLEHKVRTPLAVLQCELDEVGLTGQLTEETLNILRRQISKILEIFNLPKLEKLDGLVLLENLRQTPPQSWEGKTFWSLVERILGTDSQASWHNNLLQLSGSSRLGGQGEYLTFTDFLISINQIVALDTLLLDLFLLNSGLVLSIDCGERLIVGLKVYA